MAYSEGGLDSFEFLTRSDRTNEFVKEDQQPQGFDKGNLLMFKHNAGRGFFILKESPCYSDERPETAGNFLISQGCIKPLGWGIRPEEVGTFSDNEEHGFLALKRYQRTRFVMLPEKDYMVMSNLTGITLPDIQLATFHTVR